MAKEVIKVTDDIGIDTSDMMTIMMMIMGVYMISTMIQPIQAAQAAQSESALTYSYQGKTDPREIDVAASLKWIDLVHEHPRTPWATVYFINDGPYPVEIGINHPEERFILNACGSISISRLGAEERIAIIFFICQPTHTAHVRVVGEY